MSRFRGVPKNIGCQLAVKEIQEITKLYKRIRHLDAQIASGFKSSDLKSQRFEIAAISVAISMLIFNRFRGDSAAIFQAIRLRFSR